MKLSLYNNIGIAALTLQSVLSHSVKLSYAKSLLVLPFVTHQELLAHLQRKTTRIQSIERLIAEKPHCFANFSKRYFDSLSLTLNALQMLDQLDYLDMASDAVTCLKTEEYCVSQGKRMQRISKASRNVALVLEDSEDKLYLNLRIEL